MVDQQSSESQFQNADTVPCCKNDSSSTKYKTIKPIQVLLVLCLGEVRRKIVINMSSNNECLLLLLYW